MIAISYFWSVDNELEMGLFETKEEAKEWLINTLVEYRYVYYWYDTDENYYYESKEEIRKCMEKSTLEEIIKKSQNSSELLIVMKEK